MELFVLLCGCVGIIIESSFVLSELLTLLVVHFVEGDIFLIQVGDYLFPEPAALSSVHDQGQVIFEPEFSVWEYDETFALKSGEVLGGEVEVYVLKVGSVHQGLSRVDIRRVLLLVTAGVAHFGWNGGGNYWELAGYINWFYLLICLVNSLMNYLF